MRKALAAIVTILGAALAFGFLFAIDYRAAGVAFGVLILWVGAYVLEVDR